MFVNAERASTRSSTRWESSVADRTTIDVATPAGGWGAPWPNVAEIEAVLSHDKWTLVGGLMAQLYGIHAGIDAVRPTNDVDIVLHVETTRGIASETARALESLGYELSPSIDDRNNTAHRFPLTSVERRQSRRSRPMSSRHWSVQQSLAPFVTRFVSVSARQRP